MLSQGLYITIAGVQDARMLTDLSVRTFTDAFGKPLNTEEDMELYLREHMSLEKLTTELADVGNTFYLAWYDDALAGYAKVRKGEELPELNGIPATEIERIYVLEAYQGKKIGATLINRCISYATDNNYPIIWLGVWEHNHKAIAFYKQWGFELFSSHIFRLGTDDQTDVLMKKMLR